MHAQSAGRALEVVVLFDGTVVSVQHLRRERPARFGSRAYLGAGAALVAVAAACFGWALVLAHADAQARARHLASGAPAHAFRPARVPAAVELGAGVGFIAGLACVAAGLARRRETSAPRSFWIERDGRHPLVTLGDDGARLHPRAGMSVEITEGAATRAHAASGDEAIALAAGACARVDDDLCRYLIAPVAAPAPAPLARAARPDGRSVGIAAGSALVHGLVLALAWSIAPDPRVLFAEGELGSERMILVRDPARERPRVDEARGDADAAGTSSAAIELGGGTGRGGQGDRDTPPPAQEGGGSAAAARARAHHAGVLGVFAARPELFAAVTGAADFGASAELSSWRGGPGGRGGLDGPGLGWGYDVAPAGAGPLRTIAAGSFEVGRWSGNPSASGLRDRDAGRPPAPTMHPPRVQGGLDAAIIRRHVRRRLGRIRHCYERRLLVEPELAGTVSVAFAIGSDGTVIGVHAAGTGDRDLESCVAAAVATIAFPAAEGGGIVNVTYPFTFRSTER